MQTFIKEERLCSKIEIDQLFAKGKIIFESPFKIVFFRMAAENSFPAKMLAMVPKKKFAKATDRNKLKRRIKEAYRKNKAVLYEQTSNEGGVLLIAFIYNSNEILSYQIINKKIEFIIKRLIEKNANNK